MLTGANQTSSIPLLLPPFEFERPARVRNSAKSSWVFPQFRTTGSDFFVGCFDFFYFLEFAGEDFFDKTRIRHFEVVLLPASSVVIVLQIRSVALTEPVEYVSLLRGENFALAVPARSVKIVPVGVVRLEVRAGNFCFQNGRGIQGAIITWLFVSWAGVSRGGRGSVRAPDHRCAQFPFFQVFEILTSFQMLEFCDTDPFDFFYGGILCPTSPFCIVYFFDS